MKLESENELCWAQERKKFVGAGKKVNLLQAEPNVNADAKGDQMWWRCLRIDEMINFVQIGS